MKRQDKTRSDKKKKKSICQGDAEQSRVPPKPSEDGKGGGTVWRQQRGEVRGREEGEVGVGATRGSLVSTPTLLSVRENVSPGFIDHLSTTSRGGPGHQRF